MVRKTGEALRWVVGILRKRKVPFQISGGLAAIIHGAKRQLNDIDIDAPDARMKDILPDVRKYIVFGPKRLIKEGFDIYLLTLKYKGEMIDIGGCDSCKIFDSKKKRWVIDNSDLSKAVRKEVFGRIIPVTPKDELIRYKKRLGRDSDMIDIRELEG